ncbi:hypothetical protein PMAYCL1PPCAC_13391, partial [Pristionchus mayeri]
TRSFAMSLHFLLLFFTIGATIGAHEIVREDFANYDAERTAALALYEPGPLKCYVKNATTGTVHLQLCQVERKSPFHRPVAEFPACMLIKGPTSTTHTCIKLPSIAVLDCSKTECLSRKHESLPFSTCCCTTTGCNYRMASRAPEETPDEE